MSYYVININRTMKKLFFASVMSFLSIWGTAQDSAYVDIILTDFDSIPEVGGIVKIFNADQSFSLKGLTDQKGLFETRLPLGQTLTIDIEKFDTVFHFTQKIPVNTYGDYKIPFHIKIQYLTNVVRRFTLPVYFESAKHELDSQDKQSIDQLLKELNENQNMKIEIGAHTDADGNEGYNQALSQRRANAVRAYLLDQGIEASRIAAKGYGESKPAHSNETEMGKAKNRRVEILVAQE